MTRRSSTGAGLVWNRPASAFRGRRGTAYPLSVQDHAVGRCSALCSSVTVPVAAMLTRAMPVRDDLIHAARRGPSSVNIRLRRTGADRRQHRLPRRRGSACFACNVRPQKRIAASSCSATSTGTSGFDMPAIMSQHLTQVVQLIRPSVVQHHLTVTLPGGGGCALRGVVSKCGCAPTFMLGIAPLHGFEGRAIGPARLIDSDFGRYAVCDNHRRRSRNSRATQGEGH